MYDNIPDNAHEDNEFSDFHDSDLDPSYNPNDEDLTEHHEGQRKKSDKESAKGSTDMKCFTFDTPSLVSPVSLYKPKLWTFNLTVGDEQGISYHMMWNETIHAKRGANEIGSCLLKVLEQISTSNQNLKHLVFWSDSCGRQNKNSFISVMFSVFL